MKLKGFLAGLAGGAVAARRRRPPAGVRLRPRGGQQDGRPGHAARRRPSTAPRRTTDGRRSRRSRSTATSPAASSWSSPTSAARAPTSSARRRASRRSAPASWSTRRATSSPTRTSWTRAASARAASPWSSTRAAPRPSASPGQLVGVDVGSDVAVIKVDPSKVDLNPLPLGDSDKVVVGESVVAIGNPLGYDFSITSGIVSATGRSLAGAERPDHPQRHPDRRRHQPGQLRRPAHRQPRQGHRHQRADRLVRRRQRRPRVRRADQHRHPLAGAAQDERQGHLRLDGRQPQDPHQRHRRHAQHESQGGALVEQVSPGSPAAKAGIKGGDQTVTVQGEQFTIGGDVIVKADDTEIKTADDLIAFLGTKKPGDTITVTVERDGKTQDLSVTLAERPSNL